MQISKQAMSWQLGHGHHGLGEMLPRSQPANKSITQQKCKDKLRDFCSYYWMEIKEEKDAEGYRWMMPRKYLEACRVKKNVNSTTTPCSRPGYPWKWEELHGLHPKTSVLNGNNQVWGCNPMYLSLMAPAMTSASCVNPSLYYMA